MSKYILIWLLSIPITILILMLTGYSYYPPQGYVDTSSSDIVIQSPEGYIEYQRKITEDEIYRLNKLGRIKKAYDIGPIGIAKMQFDTSKIKNSNARDSVMLKQFVMLNNLYIKPFSRLDGGKYFVENGIPFLVKNSHKEPLPFYFQAKWNEFGALHIVANKILIPLSSTEKTILIVCLVIVSLLSAYIILIVVLGGSVRLVLNIAQANVFSRNNIGILKNIAYVFFITPLVYIIANYAIWQYIQLKYPGGFGLNPEFLFKSVKLIFIGGFFYVLYLAFKKGFKIKQENDLTV